MPEPLGMTVHGVATPDLSDPREVERSRTLRGRVRMLLVLLVCAAPVVAWQARHVSSEWQLTQAEMLRWAGSAWGARVGARGLRAGTSSCRGITSRLVLFPAPRAVWPLRAPHPPWPQL